jgi:Ca-activated chloride channel family protein
VNFLAPIAFVFALALPAVVVFYLLKRKRTRNVVPSTVLWQRFLAENQANSPFQKLRNNWLMILQLLLLALIVFALARPYFNGSVVKSGLRVIVLDASASMQSTDEKPSRFEKARADALALVDSMESKGGMRAVVLVASSSTEVRLGATSEKAALRRAISSATVTDSPTRLIEALRVAETLTRNIPDAEVHLFSDGAVEDLAEFETRDLQLVYHKAGTRVRNAGLVNLDVRANPEDPSQRAVFASVANFGTNEIRGTVELLFDEQLVETRPLSIGATNTLPLVFFASQPRDGVFSVKLLAGDDLAADDEARIVSRLPTPLKVLLVTKGNRFLEKALNASGPQVQVEVVDTYAEPATPPDVVVLDDVEPAVWPTGNVLAIHVANTNWFAEGIGTVDAPPVVDWRNTHPLLRFVGFDNVQVAQSLSVKTPGWATALVDSPQAPLVLAGETGRQRVVWVGFDVLQSTWPLRIGFPIFIANAMDWLNPETAKAARYFVHPGEALRLPLAAPAESARVKPPGAAEQVLPLGVTAREFVFAGTAKQGVYEVLIGTNKTLFAANLLDPTESDTRPRDELKLGRRGDVVATSEKRANLEYWRWFALAGLGVMLFEWWWYHKRTA